MNVIFTCCIFGYVFHSCLSARAQTFASSVIKPQDSQCLVFFGGFRVELGRTRVQILRTRTWTRTRDFYCNLDVSHFFSSNLGFGCRGKIMQVMVS